MPKGLYSHSGVQAMVLTRLEPQQAVHILPLIAGHSLFPLAPQIPHLSDLTLSSHPDLAGRIEQILFGKACSAEKDLNGYSLPGLRAHGIENQSQQKTSCRFHPISRRLKSNDGGELGEDEAAFGLGDGATELGGGFNPFLDDHFDVSQGFAIGVSVCRATGQLRHLGD
jgi:hypothetical protein